MGKYIRPRGTLDLYNEDAILLRNIEEVCFQEAYKFNVLPIYTPTFEMSSLFVRSTGETSDIVTKEMYSFKDKGDRDITLRPEGTAGAIRAIIENKLYVNDLPFKCAYFGPFFRYERPQVGRYREFYQFGVEYVGSTSYKDEVENILLVCAILKRLGINDFKIRLNTFGDSSCRNKYRDNIKEFFKSHIDCLCEDCKNRFNNNPLRILDCKVDANYFETLNVPNAIDALDESNQKYFKNVCDLLDSSNIKYEIDNRLVRGLDYYTGLIFEVDCMLKDGHTLTIGGGGRYANLVSELDGPDLNSCGFGLGVSRIALLLTDLYGKEKYANEIDYYIMPFAEDAYSQCLKLANRLKEKGYKVVLENSNKSVGSMFKYASRHNFKKAIMIGEDEIKNNNVKIKDLISQEQYFMSWEEIYG